MKNNLLLLLFLFSCSSFAQVSQGTAAIVKPLEKYKYFYILDEKIKEIEEKLDKEASSDELVFLAEKGKNPYIKVTAVKVLTKRSDKRLPAIFKNSFLSKEEITYRTECLSDSYPMSGIFFDTISSVAGSSEEEEKRREEMAITVLNTQPLNKPLLEYTSAALPVNPEIYKKLRILVLETKSPMLLMTLARHKNTDDVELIKSFGSEAYPAIEEFPHPGFLPFIKEHLSDSSGFSFMFALSNFCSDEAKEIVIKAIELDKIRNKEIDCGNGCLSTIYQQIARKKCKLYYPVLANLWLTDKIISFDVLDDYVKNHTREETEKFLLNGFLKPGEAEIIAGNMYDIGSLTHDISDNENMTYDNTLRLVRLLEKIKNISQDVYEKAVRNTLRNVDDLEVDDFISQLKNNTLVLQNKDVLLDRLKNNESAYGTLKIMDGVKMLDNQKLFQEGAVIVVSRKAEFTKFPVWEKEYSYFIQENNIKE
ncbi:MAG: hypothetical protein LBE92_05705 [Chryseobacterium sp.]|jgi:hypothetical protein|uniref:hypothetical protein n=1 Tax=Chryseobacterium sp. TaxID=1871047 RepID=UPI00282C604B|nr:hypothetical protein [Chryseobacterium sp.]MDR2235598.1 hypothetical protein [Chryseobacterium sp.]